MPQQDGLNPAQRELESALKSLPAASARLDPIAAAFAAGRRSSLRQIRLWQSTAAVALLISTAFFLIPTGNSPLAEPLYHPGSTALHQPPSQPLSDQSVLMLQKVAQEKGIDGLPAPQLPPTQTISLRDLF